ncbi:hypothetical protein niasHT_039988 [Heterodera trifolii]|uniref:Uncharacterized protein n=1 Tax=Heterodera trifolii TaxID=157864 RepID=A0ABD2J3I0_9BILA
MPSLSDLYQLRKSLSNCAVPPSDADFGILADRLGTVLASLDNNQQQQQSGYCLPISADDSPHRRSLLASLWRFVQLDLLRHQFKRIGHHPLASRISAFIFNDMRNAIFTNDRVWFGGVSRTQTFTTADLSAATNLNASPSSSSNIVAGGEDRTQMRQNSALYFALGLTLIGFYEKIEEVIPLETLRQFVANLNQMYAGSPNAFMDVLLENDERCLQTMAAIQRIFASESSGSNSNIMALLSNTNKNNVPTLLASPDILALSLLHKIHLDPLQFSHRLCQLLSTPKQLRQFSTNFLKTAQNAKNAVLDSECRFQIVHHHQRQQNSADSDNNVQLQFSIEELHGQQSVLRDVFVPTKMNCTIQQVQKQQQEQQRHDSMDLMMSSDEYECISEEHTLLAFCAELRRKLDTLSKHLHFPAKAICANLKVFTENNGLS